jgi:hypothetical protein
MVREIKYWSLNRLLILTIHLTGAVSGKGLRQQTACFTLTFLAGPVSERRNSVVISAGQANGFIRNRVLYPDHL